MLRAIWLTIQNEFRLLVKDQIVLLMLLLAPVVIITVSGYSLGSLYSGGSDPFRLPLIDRDRGEIAGAIVDALRREATVNVELLDDPKEARWMVSRRARTPLAIEIPPGTSDEVAKGGQPRLILYVDPVRRIEVNALELKIGELCRAVAVQVRAAAQEQINKSASLLAKRIRVLETSVADEQTQARASVDQAQVRLSASIRAQTDATMAEVRQQATAIIRARESSAWEQVQRQLSARQAILLRIRDYLAQLQSSQQAFGDWIVQLKTMAGSHAADIPPPPAFPQTPSDADLAQLVEPITPPKIDESIPIAASALQTSIEIPKPSAIRGDLFSPLDSFRAPSTPVLPGGLGFVEQAAPVGSVVLVNAFDQYVPGFGVTFLLIGMLMGISLTLFDEREWGTLKRLRVSGTPLAGLLIGKLIARFLVGTLQMALLFAVGRALFGISLGRDPLALLVPTVGISFAAAAFGLVIASIAKSHDSVMPLGTMTSMAMSAIGGCWWPLDFEPGWMRALARWMPTTWTMQAYNDLMIRRLPVSVVLWPFSATVGLGLLFLAAGILLTVAAED
jgi:ABC-type multidrug transport system permease subunit